MASFENRAVPAIIVPLYRLSVVKIALPLWLELDKLSLFRVSTDFETGYSANILDYLKPSLEMKKIYNHLLSSQPLFPLWKAVLDAIKGFNMEVVEWNLEHRAMLEVTDKTLFHWRGDGTIDRFQTAKHLVSNVSVDIKIRFQVACNYCLLDDIKILWCESGTLGIMGNVGTNLGCMESFWVAWLINGSIDPWPQAIFEYFESLWWNENPSLLCFRIIWNSIGENKREKCLSYMQYANADDLRFCLYSMKREEQVRVFNVYTVPKLLRLYYEMPLRPFFKETARNVLNYLDHNTFLVLLDYILRIKNYPPLLHTWGGAILTDIQSAGIDYFSYVIRVDPCLEESVNLFFRTMYSKNHIWKVKDGFLPYETSCKKTN